MKKNLLTKLFALMLVFCTLFLNSCSVFTNATDKSNSQDNVATNDGTTNNTETSNGANDTIDDNNVSHVGRLPEGAYNEGVVLVKVEDILTDALLAGLEYTSFAPLYEGAKWYTVMLGDSTNAKDAVAYLSTLEGLEGVDYDYIMSVGETTSESVEVSGNPHYDSDQKKQHKTQGVDEAWKYLKSEGMNPGGSSDVIVAVIDTGVDYNHVDLRNNIWTNPAEIPNNGVDDDGNGYIDDVRGWDCVGDDNDPMDDNGHGTHVAGIIAAENNKLGGVGIAYNCKVMVLKAGNSSGYFNNSDIIEAIQYAYMNGASVINMSFGGYSISIPMENVLENAYTSCVIVAAAGNDNICNAVPNTCEKHLDSHPIYPAALPYVIGVMSVDSDGYDVSGFSNYDHMPYNEVEYEVCAVGEVVNSTWPGNKYATLNGTSMASPVVAGIAALLRSYYADREVYSTKFIQSQIVNTGTVNPYNAILKESDGAHSVVDAYAALTRIPTPAVNLYDYYIDDSTSISSNNNGNGVIDAGETVRLYFSLHNRGGVASNVNVSIDTIRHDDPSLTDPYFTFVNPTMQLSDIGTYAVRESGDKYFEIIVDANCPNDYLTNFNIRFTYKNGLDNKDETVYKGSGQARFLVNSGYHLPGVIYESTVFTNKYLYIVGEEVIIPEGVTVTFEEGCKLQFYDGREYYKTPRFTVHGKLIFAGSEENSIFISPPGSFSNLSCDIYVEETGTVTINYVTANYLNIYDEFLVDDFDNTFIEGVRISNSTFYGFSTIYAEEIRDSCLQSTFFEAMDLYNCILVESIVYSHQNACNNLFVETEVSFFGGGRIDNNYFYSINDDIQSIPPVNFSEREDQIVTDNNSFSVEYQKHAKQIIGGYYDSDGNITVDVYGSLANAEVLWPYILSVEMFDKAGNLITTVGKEEVKVRVTFNRSMDTTKDIFVTFGTIEPYADYRFDGEYISDTVWEGTYTLKAQIENGQNYLKVNNACAAEDQTKTVYGKYLRHEFTIDTTAAMSMSLIANPTAGGIELRFAQDDYDTLLGYNIYRSESKDGNYVKLNSAIVLPTEETFLDDNAEPGKTYWYTYTVVLSDFTESKPAGKVVATAGDNMAPSLYHTPVNQGYLNNNLVISCTARDNIAIVSVTLYYRVVGSTEWKTLTMSKQNDRFSATVFGSELRIDGLEYYIVARDEYNSIAKGSEETPYTVVIKDASAISRKGDVDGDGVVTTKDALMLMQCLNDDIILSDDEFQRADLNGDGSLSSAEALRILQYINGKINTLEM